MPYGCKSCVLRLSPGKAAGNPAKRRGQADYQTTPTNGVCQRVSRLPARGRHLARRSNISLRYIDFAR